MEEKPNYYAVIPANVRYDEKLKANEKLMYGEITSLSNKTGICYASNNYFARLYKTTPQAISRWILNLQKQGYVNIDYEYSGKEIVKRIIRVSINIDRYQQIDDRGINICLQGYQQMIEDNNTRYNNTSINNKEIYKEIIDYLNLKTNKSFKTNTKDTQKHIQARLKEGFKIDDFKKVIDNKTSKWLNTDMEQYLRPTTLFGTKFESYLNENQQSLPKWFNQEYKEQEMDDERKQELEELIRGY